MIAANAKLWEDLFWVPPLRGAIDIKNQDILQGFVIKPAWEWAKVLGGGDLGKERLAFSVRINLQ